MKKSLLSLLAFLMVSGLGFSFVSCDDDNYDVDDILWSDKAIETVTTIAGDYSMVSATWSEVIDFSGSGTINDDILLQMNLYGWYGVQSIKYRNEEEGTSILYRSQVLPPSKPKALAQVNLYVPFSHFTEYGEDRPYESGRCDIEIFTYQFHYTVDTDGKITLWNVSDRHGDSKYRKLENVDVRFAEGGYLLFDADTVFYDWATSSWQEGHMSLLFRHNEPDIM